MDGAGPFEALVGYAVDRSGRASPARVFESLVRDVDLERVQETIAAYGLEAVAEQYLRALIADGMLYADAAAALAERDRVLDAEDPYEIPVVHAVSVADLADEFTRLGLTEPPPSCGG